MKKFLFTLIALMVILPIRSQDKPFVLFPTKSTDKSQEERSGLTTNIYETKDAVVVEESVPGVGSENLKITVVDSKFLTIATRAREEKEIEKKKYYKDEIVYGDYESTSTLPMPVNAHAGTAELKDGIVKIILPKASFAKKGAVNIPVKAG